MPRDASGNYSLPSGNPVVTGTTISSTWANNTMNDLATEMQDSLSRSGNGGMLVPLEFADGSAAAPGISFTNEPSSGFYRAASNDIRVSVASTDRMRFLPDATNPIQLWSGAAWRTVLHSNSAPTLGNTWTFTGTLDVNGSLPLGGATITGLNAVDVDVTDSGAYFAATDVEGVLQELGADVASNTSNISTNTSNISTNTSNISTNTSDISTLQGEFATGTFNISLLGFSPSVSATQTSYARAGDVVTMSFDSAKFGTSNSTSMTFASGTIPSALRPAGTAYVLVNVRNNGTHQLGVLGINSAGGGTFYSGLNSESFTASGSKGISQITFSYNLNT